MYQLNALRDKNIIDKVFRAARATTGAFILIVIVTSILIPQVLAVTGNSVVNAKLEWIRTPINGTVTYTNLKLGDSVRKGDILGNITNERADDNFLNSLLFEKSSIESGLFTLNNKHQQLQQKKQTLTLSVADALIQLKDQTNIRINSIETELALAKSKSADLQSLLLRYETANKEFSASDSYSVVSREIIDQQKSLLTETEAYISNQTDALKIMKADFESAVSGKFSSKNTPLEQQQLSAVNQDINALLAEKDALEFKLGRLSADIAERQKRLKLNTKHQFASRVNGALWDLGYANGSYVNNGDALVAIADSDTLTVECIFHQRYLDNIKVGDFANVNLMGSDQKLIGRVSKVMIRDSLKGSSLKAFSSSSPETNEFKVIVTLDDQQTYTPKIGQRAKVVITAKKSSPVPSILLFLSR